MNAEAKQTKSQTAHVVVECRIHSRCGRLSVSQSPADDFDEMSVACHRQLKVSVSRAGVY